MLHPAVPIGSARAAPRCSVRPRAPRRARAPTPGTPDALGPAPRALAATLHLPQSCGFVVSLWITLWHQPYLTESAKTTAHGLFHPAVSGMQVTDERSVRLPIGMAHMVILKDDSSNTIGYVVSKTRRRSSLRSPLHPDARA